MSLNLQDPLLRLTGIHPRQTGDPLFCQIPTDFARGGRRANSTPGPAREYRSFCKYNCKAYKYKTFRFIGMLPLYIEPPSYIRKNTKNSLYTHFCSHFHIIDHLFIDLGIYICIHSYIHGFDYHGIAIIFDYYCHRYCNENKFNKQCLFDTLAE